MLDVVAVVEEQQVVQPAVMARRAVVMLVEAVQRGEHEAAGVSRYVRQDEKRRRENGERDPQGRDDRDLQGQLSRRAHPRLQPRVVREMTVAPERLGDSGDGAQIEREDSVRRAAPEERSMDEVVR